MTPEPVRTCYASAPTPCVAATVTPCECLCVRPLDHAGMCQCSSCGKFYAGRKS